MPFSFAVWTIRSGCMISGMIGRSLMILRWVSWYVCSRFFGSSSRRAGQKMFRLVDVLNVTGNVLGVAEVPLRDRRVERLAIPAARQVDKLLPVDRVGHRLPNANVVPRLGRDVHVQDVR